MLIIWDQNKNRSNRQKHKVSFELASLIFEDPFQMNRLDRVVDGEERWQTIGMVNGVLLLLVAHTWEDADGEMVIRIISARKADAHERKRYEETH
ncbi:MAG: BrnT family toxin [Geobacter sp.]|nr:BrnT family toxin [Geobacter sp.]